MTPIISITSEQIVAARALLKWTQADLAEKSDSSVTPIKKAESNVSSVKESTLSGIIKAFEDNGIEFIEGGVRKKRDLSQILEGEDGVRDFYNDVANTAEKLNIEILVYAIGEEGIVKNLQNHSVFQTYRNRMLHAENSRLLMLRSEVDEEYKTAKYMELRRLPKDRNYPSLVYFVYGDKVAFITDKAGLKILIIKYGAIAETFRRQFLNYWQSAKKLG